MQKVRSDAKPLLGRRVMVTRPADPRDPLAEQLRLLGAEVVFHPAIRIEPPADWSKVDDALGRITDFDWVVFSSANGVRFLLDRLAETSAKDVSQFFTDHPKLAAIGPGTADELARYRLIAAVVPEQYRAESLAEALSSGSRGKRFLLARASRGRELLAERLSAAGALVEQIVVYSSVDVERADPGVVAQLAAGQIDWITVTSSGIANSLANIFGENLRRAKLASISPITSDALVRLGYPPAVEAAEFTVSGLAAAMTALAKE